MYTEEVMKHFRHPHNFGRIKSPDGIGRIGNIACGDIIHLYIKVKDKRISVGYFHSFPNRC